MDEEKVEQPAEQPSAEVVAAEETPAVLTPSEVTPAEEKPKKKVSKKLIGGIIAAVVVIIIVLVVLVTSIIPGSHYKKGVAAFEAGDYQVAAEELWDAGDYKDAQTLCAFSAGIVSLDNGEYGAAKGYFDSAKGAGYPEAAAFADLALSLKEEASISQEQIDAFESDEYRNIAICSAAACWYDKGRLAKAQALYAQLPEGFEFGKTSVQERIALLNEYQQFVNITGYYETNGYTLKSTSGDWYCDSSGHATVTCRINDDGSVTITASISHGILLLSVGRNASGTSTATVNSLPAELWTTGGDHSENWYGISSEGVIVHPELVTGSITSRTTGTIPRVSD